MADHPPKKKRFTVIDKQLAGSLAIHKKRLEGAAPEPVAKKKVVKEETGQQILDRHKHVGGPKEKATRLAKKADQVKRAAKKQAALTPKKKHGIISFLGFNK